LAAGTGTALTGGAVWGGWPVAVLLAVPVAAVLILLAWVLADTGRTRRLVGLIKAVRTPPAQAVAAIAPAAPGPETARPARRNRTSIDD
jgi:hypothetical protein